MPPRNAKKQPKERFLSDYIPISCHFDTHTLLTKNGEVMQTIKMTGFAHEVVGREQLELREAIREALFACIPDDSYAMWFHTIRRKHKLEPEGTYPADFSHTLNERWGQLHGWADTYVNEVYLTVVKEGESPAIGGPGGFLRGLWPPAERRHRISYLSDQLGELEDTVSRMMEHLKSFGARRLGVVEREGRMYSEVLEFLGKIVNLTSEERLLPVSDLSEYLPQHTIQFDYNAVHVAGKNGVAQHAAIISLKDYVEIPPTALHTFLSQPCEMIISESFDFVPANTVLEPSKYPRYLATLLDDPEVSQKSGIVATVEADQGRRIDYGEQQVTLMVVEPTEKELEESVAVLVRAIGKVGFVPVREDVKLEESYWAQIPGNFEFLRRNQPLPTAWAGGLCLLHKFPAGKTSGHAWGPAVTLFPTARETPYYFSFHNQAGLGHSTIIGPYGAGKTVLLNFLVSEARKFGGRLYMLDRDYASIIFLNALGGAYYHSLYQMKFNPLTLPDTPENRGFVTLWLGSLLTGTQGSVDDGTRALLKAAVEYCYSQSVEYRALSTIHYFLQQQGQSALCQMLERWGEGGQYAGLFNNTADELPLSNAIDGFEMGGIAGDPALLGPVLLYLLHRIGQSLDGKPAMLVIDEAWQLLDNPLLAPFIETWLDDMARKNCVVIFATESVEQASQSQISPAVLRHIASQIYLPNPQAGDAYHTVFGLTNEEVAMVHEMDATRRQFMLKQDGLAVVCELNLSTMPDLVSVLSATRPNIERMANLINAKGAAPAIWLPEYLEEIRKELKKAKKKRR